MKRNNYRVVRRVDLGYGDSGPSCVVRTVVWSQDSPVLDDLNTEFEEYTAVLASARTIPEVIADRLFWGDYLSLPGGRSLSARPGPMDRWEWVHWNGSATVILPLEGAARLIASELYSSGVRVTPEEVQEALVNFIDEWPPREEVFPHPELVKDFAVEDVLDELTA